METTIRTIEEAYEALESFDPALTKRALRVLVDAAEAAALPRVLPLTQHPSAAIRFVAKRAVRDLRAVAHTAPTPAREAAPTPIVAAAPPRPEEARKVVGAPAPLPVDMDPRLQRLLDAPARRREPAPRAGGVPIRWFDMEL